MTNELLIRKFSKKDQTQICILPSLKNFTNNSFVKDSLNNIWLSTIFWADAAYLSHPQRAYFNIIDFSLVTNC